MATKTTSRTSSSKKTSNAAAAAETWPKARNRKPVSQLIIAYDDELKIDKTERGKLIFTIGDLVGFVGNKLKALIAEKADLDYKDMQYAEVQFEEGGEWRPMLMLATTQKRETLYTFGASLLRKD